MMNAPLLYGRMDLDVSFEGMTMQTPVYTKLDAAELLLHSEGVCRQLKILSYHPEVIGHSKGHEIRVRSPNNDVTEANTTVQDHSDGSHLTSDTQPQMVDRGEKEELTPD